MRHNLRSAILCAVVLTVASGEPRTHSTSSRYTKVTAIHFWSFDDLTRISVSTTGDFELKCDRLEHPDRLFFDLVGTISGVGVRGAKTIPVGDKIVRQIRVAETEHGVTRIVLDLKHYARFSTSRIDNPERLVIELHHSDSVPVFGAPEPPVAAKRIFIPPSSQHFYTARPAQPAQPRIDNPPQVEPFIMALVVHAPSTNLWLAKLSGPPTSYVHSEKLVSSASASTASPTPLRVTPAPASAGPPEPARNNSQERSMTRVLGLKIHRVVIDAGHGGHDTGTVGAGGLLEKDLVLDVALRLGRLIEQKINAEVVYTRSDDAFIPLQDRTRIANESHADLFLSIHANSSPERSASGVETYYLNFTNSQAALDVASRENAGSDSSVFDLKDLVQRIALQDKIEESREFASCVQSALYAASLRLDSRSRDRGVRKAPFVVLIGASMPSILAEISFISNPHDATVLRHAEGRQRMAEALLKGVSKYTDSLSHFTVAQRGEKPAPKAIDP